MRDNASEHRGNRGGNPGRYPGDTRNERGERPARAAQAEGAKRPQQGQNRHSPARHAGFADDRNIAGTGGERPAGAGPDNRNHAKPAAGKKRFHGDNRSENRGGQGGERRAQSGNRRG